VPQWELDLGFLESYTDTRGCKKPESQRRRVIEARYSEWSRRGPGTNLQVCSCMIQKKSHDAILDISA
jgi:hypothetical protein